MVCAGAAAAWDVSSASLIAGGYLLSCKARCSTVGVLWLSQGCGNQARCSRACGSIMVCMQVEKCSSWKTCLLASCVPC
jgi:hypothetical protein